MTPYQIQSILTEESAEFIEILLYNSCGDECFNFIFWIRLPDNNFTKLEKCTLTKTG